VTLLGFIGADSQPAEDVASSENVRAVAERPFRPVLVLPSYNNAGTLAGILKRLGRLGIDTVVVNDGCTDTTAGIISAWKLDQSGTLRHVIDHPQNRGKAAALGSGFEWARSAGFTHALTLDTDGQLAPEDVPALIEAARRRPDCMVLGRRDDADPAYPARSRIGRRFSNALVRLESGADVDDSQCGLRVYPLELVAFVRCRAQRFAFETEVLTRAAWAGCAFVQVPVTCRYLPPGERVSHFRPWVDSLRSIAMHGPLVARALWPWPQRKWELAREPKRKALGWPDLVQWFNPIRAWRELRREPIAAPTLAVALALGVFIANLPLYGVQALLALYTARRLHLNPLAAVLGTQISTPPIGPILVTAAIALGHFLRRGALPIMADLNISRLGWRNVLGPILIDWTVGGLLIGFVLAVVTYFTSAVLLRLAAGHDPQARGVRSI